MGSFNHKCNFSQLPAKYGDRIAVLVGVRMTSNVLEADGFSPGNSFTPISVPIRGIYNDYGGVEEVDRTPGIEALEKYFGMDIERIVDCAERIMCGCENQLGKDYKKIKKILDEVEESPYYEEYNVEFSYIMEHEAIFDYLISFSNFAIKDKYYWQIPHEYIEELGYSKDVVGKDDGYETIIWTHDKLPKLKEHCYVWKVEDFENYSKIPHSISSLCEYIGCDVPERYNEKYYENRFKVDIEFLKEKKQNSGDLEYTFRYSKDRREYSFLRHAECGLFRGYETFMGSGYLLSSLGADNAHMKLDYMKEIIEVALLYSSMHKLQMTWGNTNYYSQDINYDLHIRFLEKCLSLAKEKVKEEEEYD